MDEGPDTTQAVWTAALPPGVRVGCDVVRRGRIGNAMERRGPEFSAVLFDDIELAEIAQGTGAGPEVRYGIKESVLKAVGRGLSGTLNLRHVGTSGAAVALAGPVAALAGPSRVEHRVSDKGDEVRTWVWLIPEEEEPP